MSAPGGHSPLARRPTIHASLVVALALSLPAARGSAAPPAGERALAQAAALTAQGELQAALGAYDRLAADGDEPTAAAADLEAARLERLLSDPQGARRRAERLARRLPQSPWGAGGRWLVADLELEGAGSPAELDAALRGFQSIVASYPPERWPALPWRTAALVREGEVSLSLGDGEGAASAFAAAVLEAPSPPWSQQAALALAEILLAEGAWADAAGYLQVVASDPDGPALERARAGRRLGLLHRLALRPAAGGARWQRARLLGGELRRPEGIAADDEGRLLVSDRGLDALLVFDPDGRLQARRDEAPAGRPYWEPDGEARVAARDLLAALDPARDRTLADPARPDRPLTSLEAAAGGGRSGVAVLSSRSGVVTLFADPPRVPPRDLTSTDGSEPVDVAAGVHGDLYVLDRRRSAVDRFTAGGSALGTVAVGVGRKPVALAVDPAGSLYVLERDSDSIGVFDARGELLERLGPALPGGLELQSPEDVAVDGSGRVFVADRRLRAVVVIE